MSAADIYANEVHDHLKRYATWLPTNHVAVGDVGQLQGNIFVRVTDLKHLGISSNVVDDPDTDASFTFRSTGTKEAAVDASASGTPLSPGIGSAKLTIAFSGMHSVYFDIFKCIGHAIDDLEDLGSKILNLVQNDKWKLDYVVVTRVVTAGSATILQANGKDAAIEFEGNASGSPVADLLKAGASVTVRSQKSVGFSVVARSELTPLFTLGKVKYSFLDRALGSDPEFYDTQTRNSIGLKKFISHVDAMPNVDFDSTTKTKNNLVLNVRLPNDGPYVDMDGILRLTTKTVGNLTRKRKAQSFTPIDLDFDTRIHRKRFLSLINKHPNIQLDDEATSADFIALNVTLPKSGEKISIEPLFDLAVKAAETKARVKMTADLAFDEIL